MSLNGMVSFILVSGTIIWKVFELLTPSKRSVNDNIWYARRSEDKALNSRKKFKCNSCIRALLDGKFWVDLVLTILSTRLFDIKSR